MKTSLFRGWICTALLVCSLPALADETYRLNIAPQPLAGALQSFAEQSGLQIVYYTKIAQGQAAPRVVGTLSASEALRQLLTGTDLIFQAVNADTIAIRTVATSSSTADDSQMHLARSQTAVTQTTRDGAAVSGEEFGPAKVEAEKQSIQEIVVTAQKRVQRIQDVPLSVSAVTGEQLKAARIKNIQDLSFSIPGFFASETQPGREVISIRGVGSDRGVAPLTGIYLDEISLTSSPSPLASGGQFVTLDVRTKDLQRVEVLKGPQGTLFGEGSVGGTVRFITNEPKLDRMEGNIATSAFGTRKGDLSYQVDGMLNLPLVSDVLGLRIVVAYQDEGGWIDRASYLNPAQVVAKDINGNKIRETRITGLWKPMERLSIKPMIVASHADIGGLNTVNVDPRSQSRYQHASSDTAKTDSLSNYEIYTLSASYDLSFAQLLSASAYTQTDGAFDDSAQVFRTGNIPGTTNGALRLTPPLILAPGETVIMGIITKDVYSKTSNWAEDLRLTSTHEGPVQWVLGAYFKKSRSEGGSRGGSDAVVAGRFFLQNSNANVIAANEYKTWAGYADATVKLPLNFEAGGGMRYFTADIEQWVLGQKATTLQSGSSDKLTYRAFVAYNVNDDIKVYANTSTGFRVGGFNSLVNIGFGAPPIVKPETVKAYEIGIKSTLFGGLLSANLALFKDDFVDIQGNTNQVTPSGVPVSWATNPGAAELEGIDVDLTLHATDRWRVMLSAEKLNSKYVKIAAVTPDVSLGDPVNYAPEYGVSAGTEYDFALSPSIASTVRLDYNVQGKSYRILRGGFTADPVGVTGPLRFLNAGFDARWKEWRFGLFARNLTDEDGSVQPSGNGLTPQARPRSFGIELERSF